MDSIHKKPAVCLEFDPWQRLQRKTPAVGRQPT